ncbi:hypothetical protein [Streptomyces sp. NPDC047525]
MRRSLLPLPGTRRLAFPPDAEETRMTFPPREQHLIKRAVHWGADR